MRRIARSLDEQKRGQGTATRLVTDVVTRRLNVRSTEAADGSANRPYLAETR